MRPKSRRLAPARRRLRFRIAAAKARQPARGFPLDQRFERFAHESGFFAQPGQRLGFSEEIVVEGERGAHGTEFSIV